MTTLILDQKPMASIHSIHSKDCEREIKFAAGCIYAVVLADYYGGKGYTTHMSERAAAKMAHKLDKEGYSYTIIDTDGKKYFKDYDCDGDVTLSAVMGEDDIDCTIC